VLHAAASTAALHFAASASLIWTPGPFADALTSTARRDLHVGVLPMKAFTKKSP
jgi:hypothetical protein